MEKILPDISDNLREHLKKQGLKSYQPKPVPDFLNPHSTSYTLCNALLLTYCWFGRKLATKQFGPRIFYSATMLSIPYFYIVSSSKLDNYENLVGKRKDLKSQLEFSPITRRAWERALEKNQEYQQTLKQEIDLLEQRLRKKNALQ